MTEQSDTERIQVDYEDATERLKIMRLEIEILESQIYIQEIKGNRIHDNQEECASSVVDKLRNRKLINIMFLGKTQSGKTGTMIAMIREYVKTNLIPLEHIYIITGLSNRDWKEQTIIMKNKT